MAPKRRASTKSEGTKKKITKRTSTKQEAKNKTWEQLFDKYRDPDSPTSMSSEGCQDFFKDIGVSLESIRPLIIAWKMNAKGIGAITKEEWIQGGEAMDVSSISALKRALTTLEKQIHTDPVQFQQLYAFCFSYAKSARQKSLEVENNNKKTALVLWDLLLAKDFDMIKSFIQFIKEKSPVKVINKDQWTSLLDFCKTVGDNFDGYDNNSSWPCLFDEYVEWKRNKE